MTAPILYSKNRRHMMRAFVLVVCLSVTCPSVAQVSKTPQAQTQIPTEPAKSPSTTSYQSTDEFAKSFDGFLRSDAYSDKTELGYWKSKKEQPKKASEEPADLSWLGKLFGWMEYLEGFASALSMLLKVLLIGLLLLAVWWIVRRYEAFGVIMERFGVSKKAAVSTYTRTYRSLAPLPDDAELLQLIDSLIKKGEYLQALSCLYRGSLRQLSLRHELPITDSQTEAQCQALLAKARTHTKGEQVFFDELVLLWQKTAYGRMIVKEPSQVAHLFGQYKTLYVGHYVTSGAAREA